MVAAVRAAIGTINAQGGVKGRPLQLDYCNESNDPNKGAACGRSVAASSDVATIGVITPFAGPAVSDALQAGGMANIAYVALTPQEFSSMNNFPNNVDAFVQAAGLVGALKADSSLKKVAIVANEGAQSQIIVDTIAAAGTNAGGTVVKKVLLPLTTIADFTPYAQQIVSSGAQVAVLSSAAPVAVGMIQAMHQIGGHVVFTSEAGTITESVLKQVGSSLGNGIYLGSPTPWIHDASSYPGVNDFVASIKAEQDRGDSNADIAKLDSSDMADWIATMQLRDVLVSIADKGQEITRASVLSALKSATNLKTYNIVKTPWNPSVKQTATSGFSNVSVTENYLLKSSDGEEKLASPDPIDVTRYLH
jgi:ABC-type branched-subunit amino acid transport system substrate-binding protein